jgi:hypothetical protein
LKRGASKGKIKNPDQLQGVRSLFLPLHSVLPKDVVPAKAGRPGKDLRR